jgi:pimeloyl-ACP methyl ester carboxylesterase
MSKIVEQKIKGLEAFSPSLFGPVVLLGSKAALNPPVMHLEVITHHPKTNSGLTPLLFVHGMFFSASVWENFLPYFAENGYEAHALSLRGHGASAGHERISRIRAAEYVEDVASVARGLRSKPVLIGHSMGGYIVQKYLERYNAPGAVLLASVPPRGMFKMLVRQAIRHPWQTLKCNLMRSPYRMIETPELAHEHFFSPEMPAEKVNRYFSRLQEESYCAALEATFLKLPRPGRINPPPMLVLSGANEVLHTRGQIEDTARAYAADLDFIPNVAHVMMLDAGWQKAADRILKWLKEKGL